jgi:hypothetical protein
MTKKRLLLSLMFKVDRITRWIRPLNRLINKIIVHGWKFPGDKYYRIGFIGEKFEFTFREKKI